MSKKMTKKQMFNQILARLTDPAEIAFIEHEIELLENKASKAGDKKPTARQMENQTMRDGIIRYFVNADEPLSMTVTDMMKYIPEVREVPDITNQRVSQNVRSMVDEGQLKRTESKGKTYFSLSD